MRRLSCLALCGLSALSVILLILVARLPSPSTMLQSKMEPTTTENITQVQIARSQDLPNTEEMVTYALQVAKPELEVSSIKTSSSTKDTNVILTRDVYVSGHERSHTELCPSLGAGLSLVILISSAPSHVAAREAVRLTWGHYASRSDVTLAFFLGAIPLELQSMINTEDALYEDLVIGRFADSDSNRTLKTLSMLEWFNTYCSSAPRLLKTEDDMFINIPNLLDFTASRMEANKTIWGRAMKKIPPQRTETSKYYLSRTQYPGEVYPDFTNSPAYLMTGDCVGLLLEIAPLFPYLRLEDVFVTGVLAERLGIPRIHADGFYNRYMSSHSCIVKRGVSIRLKHYNEQFKLWRKLLDDTIKCD